MDRLVMRGEWGWILCNGFNPRDTTWTSSGENRLAGARSTPAMDIAARPLGLPSGLGNGDSAVHVACPPTVVHYNVSCAENL